MPLTLLLVFFLSFSSNSTENRVSRGLGEGSSFPNPHDCRVLEPKFGRILLGRQVSQSRILHLHHAVVTTLFLRILTLNGIKHAIFQVKIQYNNSLHVTSLWLKSFFFLLIKLRIKI